MGDREDIAAEDRAMGRRLPFMVAAGVLVLGGIGILGAGIHLWPWSLTVAQVGLIVFAAGQWWARG